MALLGSIAGCSTPRPVNAQDRIFLGLSLEFLGDYELPQAVFENTPVGGLSAITYDRQKDRFYVLSDDRSQLAPARFYTLDIDIGQTDTGETGINDLIIEDVTFLTDEQGNSYPPGSIDPEGIAFSPRKTVFISSEGDPSQDIAPFIGEFDLETGQKKLNIPIPNRYLPDTAEKDKGVRNNLAFESLTVNPTGLVDVDPFRLFTATESATIQDDVEKADVNARIRLMHYGINPIGRPILIAEHLYLLDPASIDIISNGLTELLALKEEGNFLSLERTFGFTGAGAKIFQVVVGNATDISNVSSLKEDITQIRPLKKKLLLDLNELGIYLDNLEGMTFGPRLADGSRSLILVSDNNFNEEQITQFLLFRLAKLSGKI
ncbi:MAG: esterase-like activity of phytase family protein [Xenococcaceae cyanobacterium]